MRKFLYAKSFSENPEDLTLTEFSCWAGKRIIFGLFFYFYFTIVLSHSFFNIDQELRTINWLSILNALNTLYIYKNRSKNSLMFQFEILVVKIYRISKNPEYQEYSPEGFLQLN